MMRACGLAEGCFSVPDRRWTGGMRGGIGMQGRKRKTAGTGSGSPVWVSVVLLRPSAGWFTRCLDHSEYRLFSLSENVLSRNFLRWASSSPMVRGGLVLLETTVSITSSTPRVSQSSMRHRKTVGMDGRDRIPTEFFQGKVLEIVSDDVVRVGNQSSGEHMSVIGIGQLIK